MQNLPSIVAKLALAATLHSLVLVTPALAQATASNGAQRTQDRAEITQQRTDNEALLLTNEKACYQHFAVTDCLKKVRSAAHDKERALRRRELVINADERAERTRDVQASRAKKQQDHADKVQEQPLGMGKPGQADTEQRQRDHNAQAATRAGKAPRSEDAMAAERARHAGDAATRANAQNAKQASKQQSLQQRAAQQQTQVDKARADYDAKQADAAKRNAAHEQRMREQAEKSRNKNAQPLPTPP